MLDLAFSRAMLVSEERRLVEAEIGMLKECDDLNFSAVS